MHIHPMVETPIIPKKYHKVKNYKKSKTIYHMTNIFKTDLVLFTC